MRGPKAKGREGPWRRRDGRRGRKRGGRRRKEVKEGMEGRVVVGPEEKEGRKRRKWTEARV